MNKKIELRDGWVKSNEAISDLSQNYVCPKCGAQTESHIYNDGECEYIDAERCPKGCFKISF